MCEVRLRHHGMRTKTLARQQHTVAWPAGSWAWCARGPRIESRGSHHIIAQPISCQIGFSSSGVRVMITTCKKTAFILKCIGRLNTEYYYWSRRDCYKILQRHTVAWPAGSWAWCAGGPRIESRGSHHIIAQPISRQGLGLR